MAVAGFEMLEERRLLSGAAPVAVDDAFTTPEDTPLVVPVANSVLTNDTDAESDLLTATVVDSPTHGTLSLATDGSFTYTPEANYNGSDSFTYKANDGTSDSNVATVSITIDPVNDVPVSASDTYNTLEDTELNVAAPGVLANDTDAEGDPMTASLVTSTVNGVLNLGADGSFTYTPNANFNGTDSFTYQANDGTGNGNTTTVTINVTPVNDAPVATNDAYTTLPDQALTVNAPGVLSNDSDIDGNSLTSLLSVAPSHGTVTLDPSGSFLYTPTAGFAGVDTFTYVANDGTVDSNTATVTIQVNTPPASTNDDFVATEDTPLVVDGPGVLANDTDADGQTLAAVLVSAPSHGALTLEQNGGFTYTPDANYNGTDSFTYAASDSMVNGNTATVTLTVTAVNDAPLAQDDSYATTLDQQLIVGAPGLLSNDTDADTTDTLTAVLVDSPTHGTLNLSADGSFQYTPDTAFAGTDTFTYKVNDGTVDSNTATVTIVVNQVPVSVDDAYTTDEDTPLTLDGSGVLDNDTDADGQTLTAVLVTAPTHGSLTLNNDGSFTYTPAANFNGTDSFTYQASDGLNLGNVATVTLTVNAVNDAPVATDDAYATDEDTALVIDAPGVLANDTDVEGDTLTAAVVDNPAHGTLSLNANGSFTYTPDANYSGADSFTYLANDGTSDSSVATVAITVNPVNDAPVATDDAYTTDEDTPLVVDAPGVLANDTDADPTDTLSAAVVDAPAHGTLALNADGSFTYTPDANFNGSDSFTYLVNDGTVDSNTATVAITINSVNDLPVSQDQTVRTNVDTPLGVAAPGVLATTTDADSDPVTAVLVSDVTHGTLTLNADGSFDYTPDNGYFGTDSFTFAANDGTADGNTATVTINVNTLPAATDDAYATDEDTPLTVAATGVLANDTDADGQALTAVLLTDPANGTVVLNSDGSFTYTPNANFNGTDSFTYTANDGLEDGNTATVTITVNAVNDAPTAADDAYATDEDTTLNVDAPGVLANDTDVEGDTLTAVLVDAPAHGSLSLNGDGSFSYTPDANFNGTDSFTYMANDGTADGNVATVTITVNPVNDAPVAADDAYATDEDTQLTVDAPGVLTNDTDIEGDALTAVLVDAPAHGTLTLNADGSFTYTPAADFNGSDSFTYMANDGTADGNVATVTITVNPVNDAPVTADDTYHTNVDAPLSIAAPGVLANDTDVDGDTLSAVLVSGTTHGTLTLNADGSFDYTPDAGYVGVDTFTYMSNDGTVDGSTATVTINVNSLPASTDDAYATNEDTPLTVDAPGVLANDTDADAQTLTAVLVSDVQHGTLTLNSDGSFTYTPEANFNGTDSFTYFANDGLENGNTATVTLTVNPINDAPVATDDAYATDEDTPLTVDAPGVLGNDTDVDGNALTAILVSGPTHGTLTLNADGSFTYTPAANFNGTDSFTYNANDGTTDSSTATVTLTVNAVNDAPVATDDTYSTDVDTPLTVNPSGVLNNDTDVDGDTLTAVLVNTPAHGTVTLNANGSFTYTPDTGFVGTDTFSYVANDGTADSNEATVSIAVAPVNHAPTTSSFSILRIPGANAVVNVLAHSSDPDSDPLGIIIASEPEHGAVFVHNNGTPFDLTDDVIVYVPETDYFGADSFSYTVSDNRGGTATATVDIGVRYVGLSASPLNRRKSDLVVLGNDARNDIRLVKVNGGIKVVINGYIKGIFNPTGRIIVDGMGGDDRITAATVSNAVILHGGDGNDLLIGSKAPSQLFGEAGNDTLRGGTGRDLLDGGEGTNRYRYDV